MDNTNYYLATSTRRDGGVALIALYHFAIALLFLLGTVALAFPTLILAIVAATEAPPAAIGMVAVGLGATVTMLFTFLNLAIGYGLWKTKQWARIGAIALALLGLLAFPVGTIIGALTIWHLVKPEVAEEFERL